MSSSIITATSFHGQVKVPTRVNGTEYTEFVGVGARFGPTLESKEKHATLIKLAIADPPDCCSTPKNKVAFSSLSISTHLSSWSPV